MNPTSSKPPGRARHVFVLGDCVLTSPCPFPPGSFATAKLSLHDPNPSQTHITRPSDNRYPALAWVPMKPLFNSKPLSVLHVNKQQFGIQKVGSKYVLDSQLVKDWIHLEANLIYIASALLARTQYRLPLESEDFPPPCRYGYRRSHNSSRGAEVAAEKSRSAFGPLIGWISFLISHSLRPSRDGPPLWEMALAHANVPGDYITLLRESELVQFNDRYPRAGVIITRDCLFKDYAQHMIQHFVPYWVLWDDDIRPDEMRHLLFLRPTSDEILNAQNTTVPKFTSPDEGTLPNEDAPEGAKKQPWKLFFEKRRKLSLDLLKKETPEQTKARLQRENVASKHPCPGSRSTAKFFHWNDVKTPERVRIQLTRNDAIGKWDSYSNQQRVYDGLHNEWDICTEFGDYSSEDEDDFNARPPNRKYHEEHDWKDTLSAEYDRPVARGAEHTVSWTFPEIIYHRYGFLHPICTTDAPDPQHTWVKIEKSFGLSSTPPTSDALHRAVSQFLGHFISAPSTLPSGSMWDLGKDCATPFEMVAQDSPFRVLTLVDRGIRRYVLSARDAPTAAWVLEFEDPTTVLECLRRQERSISELTEFLSMHGAPFHTRRPRDQLCSRPQNHGPVALGWRPPLHKGTRLEYNFYQARRDRLLDRPHGRAALLEGGIVWRLAVDSLGPNSIVRVLAGPSLDVLSSGLAVRCGSKEQDWLWDDALSDLEKDTICGVYPIYTDDRTWKNQTADLSWWPKASTFAASGLYPGYWTPSCEFWFQQRMSAITDGTANLHNATEWANKLALHRPIRKLVANHRAAAKSFLESPRSEFLRQ